MARRELPEDVTTLLAHPCGCQGECQKGLKEKRCVHRWARRALVKARPCRRCEAITWHADGKCVRCEAKKRRAQR